MSEIADSPNCNTKLSKMADYHVRYSPIYSLLLSRQSPVIGRQYGIKNKATIALRWKLNGKLIAALLLTP